VALAGQIFGKHYVPRPDAHNRAIPHLDFCDAR
jgi:hypothetical protein